MWLSRELEIFSGFCAINATQVQVVFGTKVKKSVAEDESNYLVNGTALTASALFGGAGSTATLQEDGKTVILEANTVALANDISFTLTVQNIVDENYAAIPKTNKVVTGSDNTAPTVSTVTASAGASGTKSVKVKFSEPMHLGNIGTYSVNGQPAVAALSGTDNTVVNLTTSQTLVPGTEYTLQVSGVSDSEGNINTSESKTFTVSTSAVAPTITSVTQKYGFIAVTFDQPISSDSLNDLSVGVNNATDDVTLTKMGSGTPYVTVIGLDPEDSTNKTVLITVANTVYGSGTTASAELKIKNIYDVYGNKMADYTQTISLTKDTTKPTLVSATLDRTNKQDVILEFSEPVQLPVITNEITALNTTTATDVSSSYTTNVGVQVLVDESGDPVAAGVNQSKFVKLPLEAALAAGSYQFSVPAGLIQDVVGNSNAAFNFNLTADAASDTTRPVVTLKASPAAAVVNGKNTIQVEFDEEVRLADATNLNNYILNGAALPAGTVITNVSATPTDYDKFLITLPADAVTADVTNATLIVSNIRDVAGNAVATTTLNDFNTGATVDLADTKLPTIVSAEATADDTLVLTFSEPVVANGDGTGAAELNIGSVAINLDAETVSSVGNKVTITLAAGGLGAVDFSSDTLTVTAGAFQDKAATANGIDAIVAADDLAVTDKFADVTGGSVATTDNGAVSDTDNISEIAVNITAPTNAAVDTVTKYHVYIADAGAADLTTVEDVEANLTKLVTWTASKAGSAQVIPATAGLTLSDGTAVAGFNGSVDTYIVVEDDKGNKALIKQLAAAVNIAD
ncbi:hypothetical protein ACFSO0_11545 [Brevibacillus sp. GCM10020057]|uniref:hypothetical protein n=1 Tax=Brevibacillus sp. GCM10020057 TaxID=3317327 RepID=UPI00362D24E8